MNLLITRYIQLQNHRVWLNGNVDFLSEEESFGKFIRSVYGHYGIDYPKFFKMDNLCKLAFMSAEILFKGSDVIQKYPGEEIGVILENASSSLEYDLKHQDSVRDRNKYFPSPSVFVYTIPNIMVAEIAIRHKLKGENAVFILEKFDSGFIHEYVSGLFHNQQVACCLSGWIESYKEGYQSFLFFVEREDKTERLKGYQECVSLDISNMEKLFRATSR